MNDDGFIDDGLEERLIVRGDDECAGLRAQMVFEPEGRVEVLFPPGTRPAISMVRDATEARTYEEVGRFVEKEHVALD